jgi:hypothetical protein
MSSSINLNNESIILCVYYGDQRILSTGEFNRLIGESNKYISEFCNTWKYPAITLKGIQQSALQSSLNNLNKIIGIITISKDSNIDVPQNKLPRVLLSLEQFNKDGFVKIFYNNGDHCLSSVFLQKAIHLIVNPRNLFNYINPLGEVVRFDLTGPVDNELIIINEEIPSKRMTLPSYVLPSWFGLNQSPFTNNEKTSINESYMYSSGSYRYVIDPTTNIGEYRYNNISEYREKLIVL